MRVLVPFVGGAFGAGLRVWPHTILAALAARVTKRPVKRVLTRAQMFTAVGHRPNTVQQLSLGASRDGELTAIEHMARSSIGMADELINRSRTAMLLRDGIGHRRALVRAAGARIQPGKSREDLDTASGPAVVAAQIAAFREWEQPIGSRFADLSAIQQRTLVVNGIHDEMIPIPNSYRLFENLPNAVLAYPDSGHGSMFQYHRSFTRQAAAFLTSDSPLAPY